MFIFFPEVLSTDQIHFLYSDHSIDVFENLSFQKELKVDLQKARASHFVVVLGLGPYVRAGPHDSAGPYAVAKVAVDLGWP